MKKTIKIGRYINHQVHSGNNILIRDSYVSQKHCSITRDNNGNFTIRDRNSTNGTYVNGCMISSQTDYKLQPTDIIEIGDTILDWTDYFCHEEEIDTEALNMMGFSLIHSYEIVDPRNYKITIGRNPYNDIVINDPFVGCHHCTIYNLGDFFRLMNLDEHFSTYVNEKKAETEKNIWIFQHKDVIRLGNTILSWDEIRSTFENKRNNLISVEASNNHES